MTEKSFEFYLERAMKSINGGKPAKEWKRNALVWEVRDKAYQLMIDDIFKERVTERYNAFLRKCVEEEACKITKEELEALKKDEGKKLEFRGKIQAMAKDRFYDFLVNG